MLWANTGKFYSAKHSWVLWSLHPNSKFLKYIQEFKFLRKTVFILFKVYQAKQSLKLSFLEHQKIKGILHHKSWWGRDLSVRAIFLFLDLVTTLCCQNSNLVLAPDHVRCYLILGLDILCRPIYFVCVLGIFCKLFSKFIYVFCYLLSGSKIWQ